MSLVMPPGGVVVAGAEANEDGIVGDNRLSPTFHANNCNLGACAGSILSPNLRTKAAPEFAWMD